MDTKAGSAAYRAIASFISEGYGESLPPLTEILQWYVKQRTDPVAHGLLFELEYSNPRDQNDREVRYDAFRGLPLKR